MISEQASTILKPLYKFRIFVIIVSSLHILIGLVPPLLLGVLIDDLYEFAGTGTYFMIGTIGGILVILFFLGWLRSYMWQNLINRGAGIIRSYIFSNVLHKNYRFFMDHHVGDISNKVLNDAYIYVQSKLVMMPTLIINSVYAVIIFVIMLNLNTYMKLITLVFSLLFVLFYSRINIFMRKSAELERESFSEVMDETNETLTGINTIQLYSVEHYFSERFEESVEKYESLLDRLKFWQTLSTSAADTVISILPLTALLAGVLYMAYGGNITIGNIIAFYYFVPRLREPIKALTNFNMNLQNAKAVESRLDELLTKELRTGHELEKIDTIDELEFENVGFSYTDGETILKDLNIKLHRGDILAVTGQSGAGKSTLLRLLKRFVVPGEGRILVNSAKDYTEIEMQSYIRRVAAMTQDVFVFDSSIADNICFGRTFSEKHVRERAKMSVLDEFSLDANATGLSGGERQRIGLARALACEYDILILDEPTANLDCETEHAIIETLQEISRVTNCIMIVVTHSDNILNELCNKVVSLEKLH